jgi:hypothetical protein
MAEEPESELGQRLPGPLRLRSAGLGVIVAGPTLALLSLLAPFGPAAGVVVFLAVVVAVVVRTDQVILQACVGFGAIGAIGLLEAYTSTGIGFSAIELGGVAVFLGLVDVLLGSTIYRFRPGADDE